MRKRHSDFSRLLLSMPEQLRAISVAARRQSHQQALARRRSWAEAGARGRGCDLRKKFGKNALLGDETRVSFWETCGIVGYPPSPLVYWNHRVRGKLEIKSWGRVGYGQNLEPEGVSSWWLTSSYTAFALAMFCSFRFGRKGRCHRVGLWKKPGGRRQAFGVGPQTSDV